MQKPSIGRIVHYYIPSGSSDYLNGPHAAVVIDVGPFVDADGELIVGSTSAHVRLDVMWKTDGSHRVVEAPLVDDGTRPLSAYCVYPPRV